MGSLYQEMLKVQSWNKFYSVLTPVRLKAAGPDGGITTTTSPAYLQDSLAVVDLRRHTAPVRLYEIEPVEWKFEPLNGDDTLLADLEDRMPERT